MKSIETHNDLVYITRTRPVFVPVWMKTEDIESLWRGAVSFVDTWQGKPLSKWFEWDQAIRTQIKVADAYFNGDRGRLSLGFIDGTHRTRWLMQQFQRVPIGLTEEDIEKGRRSGLRLPIVGEYDTLAVEAK